jgi:SAM-dependent methyltransferase
VSGLDFDAAAVEAARTRFEIDDVHAWSFDEFMKNRPGERFDVVTAFEVLEHQEDPRSLLDGCFALTRPGGYLAISVPFRDRRPNWYEAWDEPPNHLTRWSKRSLVTALSGAGYHVLEMRTGWIASRKFLMQNVRFGIVSSRVETAQLAEHRPANRTVPVARALLRTKSAVLGGFGTVLDVGLKVIGATGISLYVLAQRPEVDGPASVRT